MIAHNSKRMSLEKQTHLITRKTIAEHSPFVKTKKENKANPKENIN